jgi:hypothetical protein
MSSFNSARGADSRNSDDTRHLSDPTRVFFARYLIRRRENCGIAAVIRVLRLTHGKYKPFELWQQIPVKPLAEPAGILQHVRRQPWF